MGWTSSFNDSELDYTFHNWFAIQKTDRQMVKYRKNAIYKRHNIYGVNFSSFLPPY